VACKLFSEAPNVVFTPIISPRLAAPELDKLRLLLLFFLFDDFYPRLTSFDLKASFWAFLDSKLVFLRLLVELLVPVPSLLELKYFRY